MSLTIAQIMAYCFPTFIVLYTAYWLGMVHAEKKLHDNAKYISIGIYDELRSKSKTALIPEHLIDAIKRKILKINLTK